MMLLIFSYEIRQSRDDEFIVLSSSLVPDRVLAVTCMTSCSLPGLELQCLSTAVRLGGLKLERGRGRRRGWRLRGKVASAACQCVLACDQLLFQSKLNWGQVILSRATSPSGAPASLSARESLSRPADRAIASSAPPHRRRCCSPPTLPS